MFINEVGQLRERFSSVLNDEAIFMGIFLYFDLGLNFYIHILLKSNGILFLKMEINSCINIKKSFVKYIWGQVTLKKE